MELPKGFSKDRLVFPYNWIHWFCGARPLDPLGVFILPGGLSFVGVLLFMAHGKFWEISAGMWLVLFWTAITFAMLYYGQYRVVQVRTRLKDRIPEGAEAAADAAVANAYAALNDRRFYLFSVLMAVLTVPLLYPAFTAACRSVWIQVWAGVFLLFASVVGGYGMGCVLACGEIIKKLVEQVGFQPDPYHPDLFMGMRELGSLAVANAVIASTGSLLFPLLFEASKMSHIPVLSPLFGLLGYYSFGVMLSAIAIAFLVPLFVIKSKVEEAKFGFLQAHEKEYQSILAEFKRVPDEGKRHLLKLLQVERAKLQQIHVFPFETEMMFKVFISILLPIIMLFLQIYLKK